MESRREANLLRLHPLAKARQTYLVISIRNIGTSLCLLHDKYFYSLPASLPISIRTTCIQQTIRENSSRFTPDRHYRKEYVKIANHGDSLKEFLQRTVG